MFIGKTGLIARGLFAKAPKLKESGEPLDRCWLFLGEPGTGKTSLALALAHHIAGHKLAVEQVNGQSCSIEVIRNWETEGWYRPLYGNMWVKVIDEIDAMSPAACNQARTWLAKLMPGVTVLATTNKPLEKLQEQLQSRFKVYFFEPVAPADIATWLVRYYPALNPDMASRISMSTNGNVRAAKASALSVIEMQEAVA
jgi:replication-associated recombination protein RarA